MNRRLKVTSAKRIVLSIVLGFCFSLSLIIKQNDKKDQNPNVVKMEQKLIQQGYQLYLDKIADHLTLAI